MAAERAAPIRMDEEGLRARLEGVLRERFGGAPRVGSLERTHSEFATVFPADVLRVTMDDGRELQIFLKHLGDTDHPEKKTPDKEIRIYAELLADADVPVPAYYGSGWNAETGRHELYLEYIDDWSLKYQDLEEWYRAAAALADVHAAFAVRAEDLRACDALPALDEPYYAGVAARAREQLSRHTPALADPLDEVLRGYEEVIAVLTQAPPTLVNADLSPRNVIADRSRTPSRLAFIDWESAGRGCGVLDIVHLAYGLRGEPRRRMLDAYFGGLEGTPLEPASGAARRRLVAASEAHKTMYRLARCNYRGYSAETTETLVGIARASREALRRASRSGLP